MSTIKKMLLLSIAAALAAAFAVPAVASASMKFTGDTEYNTLGSGVSGCETNLTLSDDKTVVTSFRVLPQTCSGFGELYEGCELVRSDAKGLPWDVQAKSKDLEIQDVEVEYTFKPGCPGGSTVVVTPEWTIATPDDMGQPGSLDFEALGAATLTIESELFELPAEIVGTLQAVESEEWLEGGTPIETSAFTELDGNLQLLSMGSGWECPVQVEAALFPGDEGEISKFAIDGGGCKGFGAYESCSVESAETSAEAIAPWPIAVSGSGGISISDLWFVLHFNQGCQAALWDVRAGGDLVATPDNHLAISSLDASGIVDIGGFPQELTMQLEAASPGTYGFN